MVSGQDLRLDVGKLFNQSLPPPRINPSNDFSHARESTCLLQIAEENWRNYFVRG